MAKSNPFEMVPLVDGDGNVIGCSTRHDVHCGTKLLHPVVHLHIKNSQGDIMLQKRSFEKKIQPGKWDTFVGGHVDFGESVKDALMRESEEEVGVDATDSSFVVCYEFESDIERELVNVYMLKSYMDAGSVKFAHDEIDEVAYFSGEYIMSHKEEFTPNFLYEFERYVNDL